MSLTPFRMVIPYYENPGMLVRQIAVWNLYAGELRDSVGVILVDDGSPRRPALDVIRDHPCTLKLGLWRIAENIAWNQHGARNLGAKVAGAGWLFMTDIDHLLMPDQALVLAAKPLDPARHYTVERTSLPELRPYKHHCNTFAVTRQAYMAVGGYDEDYCGAYGGDGPFLRQLAAYVPEERLRDVHVVRVPREVQPDASTTEWPRTGALKERYRRLHEDKRRRGDEKARNPLRFTWERLL